VDCRREHRKLRNWGLAVVILAFAATVLVASQSTSPLYEGGSLAFDSDTWKAKEDAGASDRTRHRMVDDLRAKGTLRGLDRSQVVALLGEPSTYRRDPRSLVWSLGQARGIGIDRAWFEVVLGADGRVVDAHVFQR
jgi:hypothetical protein